jgi:cellulose synthase/poly-beta-1,6-N-acetylglucosamine synthase-like glycosyltransferase
MNESLRALANWVLWGAMALLAYSYVIYPALMISISAIVRRTRTPATQDSSGELPTVAVVVAAYNEEHTIAGRIENLLKQDYPSDRLHIFIGSDGGSDRTADVAARFAGTNVTVRAFSTNRGKASVLNDLVAEATAAVIVFTDANTVFAPDTVRRLATSFDSRTAAVCGELILGTTGAGSNRDHQYWNFERRLKLAESAIGGLLGANGGVYAIRRDAFQPLRPDTICDDFVIAMNIAVEGRAVGYVPAAAAFEEIPADVEAEFHRRVRIGIGNYQALFRHPRYLYAGSAALGFTYFSHKVLRWLTPHLGLAILAATIVKADEPVYLAFAAAQIAALLVAWLVHSTRAQIAWPGPLRLASYFAVLNLAFLVGFSSFLRGNYRGSWRRTARG